MKNCLLTHSFDGNEAIVANKKQVKEICRLCEDFKDCDWESQDCIEKFLKAIDLKIPIEYVEAK